MQASMFLTSSALTTVLGLVCTSGGLAWGQDAPRAVPPLPSRGHAVAPALPDADLPEGTIRAVLARSWDSGLASAWGELNVEWPHYGTRPIAIDYTAIAGLPLFTYAQLAATGADVVILSNPAGGVEQYSPSEIAAIQRYAREGHNVLGTFAVFEWGGVNNHGLAPIFGLPGDTRFDALQAISNQFNILHHTPLTRGLGTTGWTSTGYPYTQVPTNHSSWGSLGLQGAVPVAECDGMAALVTLFRTPTYVGIYISSMPEYFGTASDKQLLYNAITFQAR